MHEGIELGLSGQIEKNADTLGRNAVWNKQERIDRLPRYLCVQFARFYWKEAMVFEEGREVQRGQKCKIMKPVSFPDIFDVFNFCSDKVKAILKVQRHRHAMEILNKTGGEAPADGDAAMADAPPAPPAEGASAAAAAAVPPAAPAAAASSAAAPMEEDDELAAALKMSMGDATAAAAPAADAVAGPGLPVDFQGNYELYAVVTHQGRSADGGHYMGWVRAAGADNDQWHIFDDADVTECKTEDVTNLKGGGDWPMAYLCFYRAKL